MGSNISALAPDTFTPVGGVAHALNVATLRLTAFMAGGSLLVSAIAVLSTARGYPHPGHHALMALLTALLGLFMLVGAVGLAFHNRRPALLLFGSVAVMGIVLPLVRYVPIVYTVVYERDLESFFPAMWPYSLSVPLLVATVLELALLRRRRSAPAWLVGASVVIASLVMFFGSIVISRMAASDVFVVLPERTLLALTAAVALSSMVVAGAVAATRGLAWLGVLVLFLTGVTLEIASTYFYGGIPRNLTDLVVANPPSPWTSFAAGTLSGTLALVLSVLAFQFGTREEALTK
jgi:hypothetical protein